jgi:hypothetical protein
LTVVLLMLTRFTLAADVVRGHINFTRPERKPSHIAAEADAPGANKDHQRWRIHRAHGHRSGHPAPASADNHPASVVIWRVAPRRVIHPRPSPRRDPVPMAFAIRRPARRHPVGVPDMSVVGVIAPVAIIVQVVIADHILRHVLRRARVVVPVFALVCSVIKCIRAADLNHVGG